MGSTNSFSTLFKQKVNTLLNKYEDLTDYTSTTSGAGIEGTLQKMTANSPAEELAKLRTSKDKKQDQPEINEEKTVKQKTDGQEESVVAE